MRFLCTYAASTTVWSTIYIRYIELLQSHRWHDTLMSLFGATVMALGLLIVQPNTSAAQGSFGLSRPFTPTPTSGPIPPSQEMKVLTLLECRGLVLLLQDLKQS